MRTQSRAVLLASVLTVTSVTVAGASVPVVTAAQVQAGPVATLPAEPVSDAPFEAPPAVTEKVAVGADATEAVEQLAAPVDPLGDPAGFVDIAVTWWKAGWVLPWFILIAYGLLAIAARKVAWLTNPRNAIWTAAGVAVLGDLVVRLSTGAPMALPILFAALGMGWSTILNGKAAAKAQEAKTDVPPATHGEIQSKAPRS